MIPTDFKDFFISSSSSIQQEIVSSLLSLSLQESEVIDKGDVKAVNCPHCSCKHIRANGKLKELQRFCNGCKKNFSKRANFGITLKRKRN